MLRRGCGPRMGKIPSPQNTMRSLFAGTLLSLLAAATLAAADQPAQPARKSVWGGGEPAQRGPNPLATLLPRISVKGNRFVDPSGQPVLFRGLSIADPDKIDEEGRWNPGLFAAIKDFGANLVRIPVHPAAWRARGKEGYLKLLDQAVDWSAEKGMHVIIDWHSIGNLGSGMYQDRNDYS